MACVTDPTISPANSYCNPDDAIYQGSGSPLYNLPCGQPVYAATGWLIPGGSPGASGGNSPTATDGGAQASGATPNWAKWLHDEISKAPGFGELLWVIDQFNLGVEWIQSLAKKIADTLHVPVDEVNSFLGVLEVGGVLLLAVKFLHAAIL